jgi:hypothetical protein
MERAPECESGGYELVALGGFFKTIVLDDWQRVLMNTEHQAPGSRNVVFLD